MKFKTPEIKEVEYRGTHLFASQTFCDGHPQLINHLFCVPDMEYRGAYFDQYCQAVIDGFLKDSEDPERSTV